MTDQQKLDLHYAEYLRIKGAIAQTSNELYQYLNQSPHPDMVTMLQHDLHLLQQRFAEIITQLETLGIKPATLLLKDNGIAIDLLADPSTVKLVSFENEPESKIYNMHLNWTMQATVQVEARSFEEADRKLDHYDTDRLIDAEYVDNSMELNAEHTAFLNDDDVRKEIALSYELAGEISPDLRKSIIESIKAGSQNGNDWHLDIHITTWENLDERELLEIAEAIRLGETSDHSPCDWELFIK